MLGSGFVEFKVNYEQTKDLAINKAIHSDTFSAGGHMWRINCFPRGTKEFEQGNYLSIYVELVSKRRSANAIFETFLMGKDGQTSSTATRRSDVHLFQQEDWGWSRFVSHTDLVENYVIEGHITIICAVMVMKDSSIPVPPAEIAKHLGTLLDSSDGTDVSFVIDSETFHAHRAVLAARSPVFKAELLGSMAEATMSSITLNDISPATFRVMLRFIYTDALPGDDELGDPPSEMLRNLLAAADRYA
ncbi:hypothetical protein ACP70R_016113 [Stipagrostis hirtigluma subsp. patula]